MDLGHSVTVVTMAPAGFFVRELPSPRVAIRKAQLDFGAKQKDAFSVDMAGAVMPACMRRSGKPFIWKLLHLSSPAAPPCF